MIGGCCVDASTPGWPCRHVRQDGQPVWRVILPATHRLVPPDRSRPGQPAHGPGRGRRAGGHVSRLDRVWRVRAARRDYRRRARMLLRHHAWRGPRDRDRPRGADRLAGREHQERLLFHHVGVRAALREIRRKGEREGGSMPPTSSSVGYPRCATVSSAGSRSTSAPTRSRR